jgi:hypothetical protein
MKLGRDIGLVMAVVLFPVFMGYGQSDSMKVRECLALYQDNLKMKNYEAALIPLEWLLLNQPKLSKSLYIDGVKVHDRLFSNTITDSMTRLHSFRVLELYHKRMKIFGEKELIYNHAANKAYKYFRKDVDMTDTLIRLLDSAILLNKENVFQVNYLAYADLLRIKSLHLNADPKWLFSKYWFIETTVSGNSEFLESKGFDRYRAIINLLFKEVNWSCNLLESSIPSLETLNDYMMRNLIRLYHLANCRQSHTYLQALRRYYDYNSSPRIAFFIASQYMEKREYGNAEFYFLEIIEQGDSLLTPKSHLALAKILWKRGDRRSAYNEGLKALGAPVIEKEVYEFLGDLFFNSYQECVQGKSRVYDRLCFVIAYEYYSKAGIPEKMKSCTQQFPAIEDIFLENFSPGQELIFDCWIEKKITLRARNQN